jgi:TrkA domain protein
MDVTESDLPGVGKKHELDLGGEAVVVITHNSGKRELYHRAEEDADSEKLLELTDRQARTLGTVLEGAYFQPVASDAVETLLAEGTLLEWYAVEADSPLVGETLESAAVGRDTGATVLAIQRDEEVIASPGPAAEVRPGDTLVVVGDRESCDRLEALLDGGE